MAHRRDIEAADRTRAVVNRSPTGREAVAGSAPTGLAWPRQSVRAVPLTPPAV